MSATDDLRPLLGVEVDVDTGASMVHGTLLSCTRSTIWLVAGDDDVLVPVDAVRSVRRSA